jgi:hypothetical protein
MGEGALADAVVRDPRPTAVGVLRRNLQEVLQGACQFSPGAGATNPPGASAGLAAVEIVQFNQAVIVFVGVFGNL